MSQLNAWRITSPRSSCRVLWAVPLKEAWLVCRDMLIMGLWGQPAKGCWRSLGLKYQDSFVFLGRSCISRVWCETRGCKAIPELHLFPWNAQCVGPDFSYRMEIIDEKRSNRLLRIDIYSRQGSPVVHSFVYLCHSCMTPSCWGRSSKPLFPAIPTRWQVTCCFLCFCRCPNIEMQS